jgi:uncharacterized protein YfaS (alpha-2-macroglobulin family)
MITMMRANLLSAVAATCLVFASIASSANKLFTNTDLADSAIQLEARVKADASKPVKSLLEIRRDANAAFSKNNFGAAVPLLEQIVAAAPKDTATWLRLAGALQQIRPANEEERATLLERASDAAYIAYQRTTNRNEEADSLELLGTLLSQRKLWRPALDALRLSLEAREVADVRTQYEQLRDQYGYRVLDYTIDADTASPRACFQFSEQMPAHIDYSPFVVLSGTDKPALSVAEQQLCVEGLKHGEHYTVTLRAGLPSVVHETLSKAADYTIYVRDRKPFVRFSTSGYVLPRTGQRGIPIISVNTSLVAVEIYRITDRNLIETITGYGYSRGDFQKSLDRSDLSRLAESRGVAVWKGDLAVDASALNAEVTTAFPVDGVIGELKAGVYVMVAQPQEAKNIDNNYDSLATQWFIVSDLGLTAFSGNDGIHVFVTSLASTDAKSGVEVRLISRGNEILAMRKTDISGHAQFEPGLIAGEGAAAPALLAAADPQEDFAFLSLKTPAFDLTDRGVDGRPAPNGLDAFIYAERGVYRSGEIVHLTALLRDAHATAAPNVPLTLVIERPDGVEYKRAVVMDQGIGGHTLDLPISPSAPIGSWHVSAYTDPKRPPVGEATFLVEDYVPDRIEFDLSSPTGHISPAVPAEVNLSGRFLYGAPAANLNLEGEVRVAAAKERFGFAGYQFGVADESLEASRQSLDELPSTDEAGKAKIAINLDKLPSSTHPLEAQIAIRVAESGGRAIERRITLPVTPSDNMIGVKRLFSGQSLADGTSANFDVIVAAPNGTIVAQEGLHYELDRVETHYQYYKRDGDWHFEPVKVTTRVADGTTNTTPDYVARISLPVSFGRYRLVVSTGASSGPETSVNFDAGWYVDANADTPDMLEVALDKSEYRPGDTMTVAITARSAGRVALNVIGDKLLASQTAEVKEGLAQIKMTVGTDWGSGAYLVATLRRSLDAPSQRMPSRAIGVKWFSIDRAAKTLTISLAAPALQRPESTLRIPVKVEGLAAGEEARAVVTAVDVGILNLTNYKPPSPGDYYLGQRALSADIRDLYGQLINGMQGARGEIRSGGDAGAQLQGSPPAGPPVAFYSGLVTVGKDGMAEVSFDVPDFVGTLRVMAVAWTKSKLGHVTSDVTVRDPVVLTAALPRFLLAGDRSTMHLDIDNVEGQRGDYTIAVTTADAVTASAGATQKLNLLAKERGSISVPIIAQAAGTGSVKVSVSGPAGFALMRSYALPVPAPAHILARRMIKPLAKGESLTLSSSMFDDLVPGTGSVSISVGASTALDAAELLAALDRYPYRCSEQITSRALPLLYMSDLAAAAHVATSTETEQRIRETIDALLTRQGGNGSFGLWSPGGNDLWLDSYVTDFLTRSREHKFAVPDGAFRLALDRLRNEVANLSDPGKNGATGLAYAYYVLSRNGIAPIGDLRYLADAKLDALATPIAKAQIAAALAMVGDRARAEHVYAAAVAPLAPQSDVDREDYGSNLRDAAALVTLAAEGGASSATMRDAVQRVEAARATLRPTSTQEDAWLLLAANAVAKDAANISLSVSGEAMKQALYRTLNSADLTTPITITNTGDNELRAVVTVSGAPLTPEPATEAGFKVERQTFTLDGDPVDATQVKQNTRLVVVLKVTEAQPQFGRLIVSDYLPAGFEIDNPHLVSSGDTGTLSWIEDAIEPVSTEFRDDRFTAAFERHKKDPAVFTVAYVVRAVSLGKYVRPQASVEDMYRPERFGRTGSGSVEVVAVK